MTYHVTRQNGFYDEEPRIEIATARDEISPGMLVTKYDQEGEYDTAQAAIEAAIELQDTLDTQEFDWPITISSAASLGLYPTADDSRTVEELKEWARLHDEDSEENVLEEVEGYVIEDED